MNKWIIKLLRVIDVMIFPPVYVSAWLFKFIRRAGVHRLPFCKRALMSVGVFPIDDHYYEPQFDYRTLSRPLSQDRSLPGIEWNVSGQLELLAQLTHTRELRDLQKMGADGVGFNFDNESFASGDAEYWYQIIRAVKPKRVFEVGSGYSTLLALRAIRKNRDEDPQYECRHVCIEPYEAPWLEATGVSVIRKKVEDLGAAYFSELQENDILFIDSSHIIRPQGDILFEYLEVLPSLNKGVIVHIHDIFSPKNYLKQWLEDEAKFWNEQYLLEAFLSNNGCWKILAALNYLHHNHYDKLKSVAPALTPSREPGSFYIQKIS